MTQAQEIAIEPGQSVDLHATGVLCVHLQSLFFTVDDMVMPYIRRITDQQVKLFGSLWRFCLSEVLQADIQPRFTP